MTPLTTQKMALAYKTNDSAFTLHSAAPATDATVNAGAINKLAYAYQTNNTAASLNAGAAATDNTVTLPTVDRLCIGATVLQQGHLNGAIRSISYYPTRLADATLQSITS